MRTTFILLTGVWALTMLPAVGQAQQTTPTAKSVQPYRRFMRVAVVSATAPVKEGEKPLAPTLEITAANALRERFSLPPYARVTPESIEAALKAWKEAHNKPLVELPSGEIPAALKVIGESVPSDRVLYVLVREATSKQVTIQIWEIETDTGKILVDGKLLRRSWDDYPTVKNAPDGAISSSIVVPPLSADAQSRLITRMLSEWNYSEANSSK